MGKMEFNYTFFYIFLVVREKGIRGRGLQREMGMV
jgi:hypothetical protein